MRSIKTKSLILICLYLLFGTLSHVNADAPDLTIVSQNLKRFFDDKDDGNHEKVLKRNVYTKRLDLLVNKISTTYQFADVIAFQEIENIDILNNVSELIYQRFQHQYQAVLIEGNDQSGIDVGYLVKQPIKISNVYALFSEDLISKRRGYLFSRPPLVIELCKKQCYTIVNLHLRSMRGLSSRKKNRYVALKRKVQAEKMAKWINSFQHTNSWKNLVIIGDFNALSTSDKHVDTLGTIIGNPNQITPKYQSSDLIDLDLIDMTKQVHQSRRYSYRYKRKKQQLDYVLVNRQLASQVKNIEFSTIDYQFSDHAALIIQFKK